MHRLRYLIGTLTLLAAIAGAFWMVRLLRNLDQLPGMALQVEFREARGLRAGADVRFRGVTVGTVRAVTIAKDGGKAVAHVVLQPHAAEHACVNSAFWIVTPRFAGLTDGATGLDTLVRDSYLAFHTPSERGSPLVAGSLLAGRERPPALAETEALEPVGHGDLLMSLLVPENHGLRAGSTVFFRGMPTGDVRSVELSPTGTHVEVTLRIARKHRQTVTDKSVFWVARPYVSGALFSGFTVGDVGSLLSPYVSYYSAPGAGAPVSDGYRAAARTSRPEAEPAAVPSEALQQVVRPREPVADDVVTVAITYTAVERDTWSPDDPIHRQGTGLLFLDRAGRAIVVTARSLVDGAFTETDVFGGDPDVGEEQIKVQLAGGSVHRAGRVWVDPNGADVAALVLDDAPPDLVCTPAAKLSFDAAGIAGAVELRASGPNGLPLAAEPQLPAAPGEKLGGAVCSGGRAVGILGARPEPAQLVPLANVPADLRPQ